MKLERSFQASVQIIPLLFIVWIKNVCALSLKDSPVIIGGFNVSLEQVNGDIFSDEEENREIDYYELSDDKLLYNLSDNCINFIGENSTEDLKIINVSSHSLTILWNDTTGEIADRYHIVWFENEKKIGSACQNSSFFTFTIKNLKACTTYRIRVTSKSSHHQSTKKEINATTCKIRPSECLNVTVTPVKIDGSLFLNISWNAPETGGNCIKKYKIILEAEIHGRKHRVCSETNDTNISVGQLHACTSYAVTIHAVDVDNDPGASFEILAPPTLAKVRIPPRLANNTPFKTTSTTITLNWNVVDESNNCSISSVQSRCRYIYSLGSGYELKESENSVKVVEENPQTVSVLVDNLSPYTKYHCLGRVENVAGYSFHSYPVPDVVTKQAVPSAPEDFKLEDPEDFKFTWSKPQLIPGHMIKYRMTFFSDPLYPMPTACKVVRRVAVVDNIDPNLNSFVWKEGEGYSRYTAYIEAQTGAGWGTKSAELTFDSELKGVSDEVTNLRYELVPRKSDVNVLEAQLHWNLPCSLKGVLTSFDVRVHGSKDDLENHTMHVLKEVDPGNITNDMDFSLNFGELKPEYYYKFEVAALIRYSPSVGAVARHWAPYPAGIPPQPNTSYMQSITLHPNKILSSTSTFEILLPLFADTSGDVRYYAVIVSRQDSQGEAAEGRWNSTDEGWPNISSWKESMEHDFEFPYQVTEPFWSPYPNFILNYGSIRAVKFVVGNDITCRDVSLATENKLYCNGPLNPDTWYKVRMRAFTSGGYSDSPAILVKTKAEISAILIVSIVLGLLVVGMILSMIIAGKVYFKRKEKNIKSVAEDTDTDEGSRQSRRMTLPECSQDTSS